MAAGGQARAGAARGASGSRSRQTSSHKAAGKRPSKRLKCEKNSRVKSGLEGRTCGIGNPPAPQTPAERDPSQDSGDHDVIQTKKNESIPETSGEKQEKEHDASSEPFTVKSSSAPSKTDSSENLQDGACREEESSCESAISEGTSLKDGDIPKKATELDNSAFLDEDSNQPMPLDRFFGNIDFMEDQLAAVLPSTTMSRREYRRLHFIAKEDEEEDEDVL